MTFYQTNKRNPEHPFSENEFYVTLSELLKDCVPNYDQYLKDIIHSELWMKSGDYLKPIYQGSKDGEILDYYVSVSIANYLLWELFLSSVDGDYANTIDLRIEQLNEAIGPRTGELVIKAY